MITSKSIRQFFLLTVIFALPYPEVYVLGNPYLFLPMVAFICYFLFSLDQIGRLLALRYVKPFIIPLFLFFLLMAVINAVHYVPGSMGIAISFMQRLIIYAVFFVMVINELIIDARLLRRMKIALIVSMALSGCMLLTGVGVSYHGGRSLILDTNPNVTATLSVVCIFWLIGFLNEQNLSTSRVLLCFGMIASFVGVVIQSGSRGAVVFLFLGLIVYYIFIKKSLSFKVAMFIPAVIAGLILFQFVVSSNVFEKRFEEEERRQDFGGRLAIWEFSWEVFRENMAFGIGPANFQLAVMSRFGHYRSTHNEYLLILCYSGLVGFSLFAFFLYRIGRSLLRTIAIQRDAGPSILLVIFLIVLVNLFKGGGALMTFHTWFLLAFVVGSSVQMFVARRKLHLLYFFIAQR